MQDAALNRITAVAGILTVALTVVAIAIFASASPPAEADSPQQVAQFFADHHAAMQVALYIAALSLGFNLAFYWALREVLRRHDPASEWLATLGAVGGSTFIAVLFAAFAIPMQLAYREGAIGADLQRALFDTYGFMVAMSGVPTAVSVVAISAVVFRTGVLARWLGWWGIAVAVVHVVSVGALAHEGLFSPSVFAGIVAPVMFELWVLTISVLLLMRPAGAP